jgi:CheY-like chemotaxis protein/two-component sensor histidine kinase
LLTREKRARREAEEANRSKDEFLAMLGHELRNPLAPILTALQLMQLRKGGPTERERTIIERQVYHLTRLVDDLLDISRITRGNIRLKKEEVELAVVVAKAIEMTSPLIEERMHYLAVDVPSSGLPVNGDPARLVQAISNLLTNAAKYTEPRGRIWIKATGNGNHIELRVRDNGIGMDAGLVSHVFDLFYQGSQRSDRSQGGLGIGLAIVRSLILLHDGSVEALSEGAGKGSEFIVRLPALEGQTAAQVVEHKTPPLRSAEAPVGLRVFIVDDNEDAALLLAEALSEKGHVTRTAFDPVSALELVPGFMPDVILLDIGLPVMDGYELADRIRRIPELHRARLFALTGYGQDSYRAQSVGLGFERHLAKPVEVEILDSLIRTTGSSDTV